jgi:CRISPR/Cas system-associated exonuclease Cas4 (RecB family)
VVKDMFDDFDKISGSYSLLKHNFKTLDWEFSEDDLNRTKEKIATVGGYIENEERWIKKPSTLCNWCDYKSICQPDSWI